MTNKELQDYLKKFPDDAEIWEEHDCLYSLKKIPFCEDIALGIKEEDGDEYYYNGDIDWSYEHAEPLNPSKIKIIVI
jgi:hypothetical protein